MMLIGKEYTANRKQTVSAVLRVKRVEILETEVIPICHRSDLEVKQKSCHREIEVKSKRLDHWLSSFQMGLEPDDLTGNAKGIGQQDWIMESDQTDIAPLYFSVSTLIVCN